MNNEKILSAIINNDFYFHPHFYEYICEHEGMRVLVLRREPCRYEEILLERIEKYKGTTTAYDLECVLQKFKIL